jgi:hypothetical protein
MLLAFLAPFTFRRSPFRANFMFLVKKRLREIASNILSRWV